MGNIIKTFTRVQTDMQKIHHCSIVTVYQYAFDHYGQEDKNNATVSILTLNINDCTTACDHVFTSVSLNIRVHKVTKQDKYQQSNVQKFYFA
jgi:1-aminocyclopropane-1-carboxylate deaminase/D-cysteine desulfhydrase-like pyridoxal-dependent ACC family enzyme